MSTSPSNASVLVISDDDSLIQPLREILPPCQLRSGKSWEAAVPLLQSPPPIAIFLDLRASAPREFPPRMLDCLGRHADRGCPIIAISDRGYDCDWALRADRIIAGQIGFPLDQQQLARVLGGQQVNGQRNLLGPLNPYVLGGETVKYKTYTPEMFPLLDELEKMAVHNVTMLLVGETGTGKTTLARLIHELSPRCGARFLTVACGALPGELIESELFGHTKGAFTSADQTRQGKFDAAGEGTLLLDEIDVLKLPQQAKLLRVLETGEFEPVGSNETRTSLARLIVASNLDLKELMDGGLFRADLYYRLNMMEYRLPPLRERRADIVPLALDFIRDFCSSHDVNVRRVHPDFFACLKAYEWPGNVRELKNHVRRAVLFCRTDFLTPNDLAVQIRQAAEKVPSGPPPQSKPTGLNGSQTLCDRVAHSERHILQEALRARQQPDHDGTVAGAQPRWTL